MMCPYLKCVLRFMAALLSLSLGCLAYSTVHGVPFKLSFKLLQEIVQGLKVFATKPDNLHLIPRADIVEQRNVS